MNSRETDCWVRCQISGFHKPCRSVESSDSVAVLSTIMEQDFHTLQERNHRTVNRMAVTSSAVACIILVWHT
jgi:hypothetical protein